MRLLENSMGETRRRELAMRALKIALQNSSPLILARNTVNLELALIRPEDVEESQLYVQEV